MGRLFWLGVFAFLYCVILELMLVAAVLYWPNFSENVTALKLMAPIPALKDIVAQIEEGGAFPYVAGSRACSSWIAVSRSTTSSAIGAARRVVWLTCRDISSLVAARKSSSACHIW